MTIYRLYADRDLQLDVNLLTSVFPVALADALDRARSNPAYRDAEAAKALGHPDVIAPPTFLTVLGFRLGVGPVGDPELGLNYALVVHGEQRYVHHRPVRPGDVLTATSVVEDIRDAGRNELLTIRQEVQTTEGERIATAYNTIVSRGTAAPAQEG